MKKIHIYYLNKIKETLAKEFTEQDSEEPDKRKIYIYERTLRHWIDKAQLSDDEWLDLYTLIDWQNDDCVSTLKANGWEILTGEKVSAPKERIDNGFENYDKLKSQIAFFKEETERAKLSLNKKIEEYNQLSFRFCQQSYEKYKLLSNFVEKLKEKSYLNNYFEEVIRINDIDKILEESKNDN